MQIGFKTGPKNWDEGKQIVTEDGAKLCEVWFRIDKKDEYTDMLAWLQAQNVAIGLHHWGLIEGKYKTNLGSSHPTIRQKTIQQIKDTIDVGAALKNCAYVNAHCPAQGTEEVSFEQSTQILSKDYWSDIPTMEKLFFEAAAELFAYAKDKGVLLTIETLIGREPAGRQEDRTKCYDAGDMNFKTLLRLQDYAGYLANDITHTGSQICIETSDREEMWQQLLAFTQEAASITRLVHVNTLVEPFNGTDSHNGLLAEDWMAGAWPSREQVKELLALFKDRNDVLVIPEPKDKMRENYAALVALVKEI